MKHNESRAIRLHHLARIKNKRSEYTIARCTENGEEEQFRRIIGIIANTAAICSCSMCGNPRKHFRRKTLRELSDMEIIEFIACDVKTSEDSEIENTDITE